MREATVERVERVVAFGAPYVVTLAVVEGSNPAAIHRIQGEHTVVGRGEDADFILDDPQVSKAHFALEVVGPAFILVDLDSRNGTKVNERPLSPGTRLRLKHLDEIEVGGTRLLFTANRFRT